MPSYASPSISGLSLYLRPLPLSLPSSYLRWTPGLPPGVCNIVYGTGPRAGEAIVKHPSVPIISFTGSTAVGQRIQSVSAPFVKRLSLEVYTYTTEHEWFRGRDSQLRTALKSKCWLQQSTIIYISYCNMDYRTTCDGKDNEPIIKQLEYMYLFRP